MKRLFPDSIFSRLFLLLFVTLTVSHFVGMEVFSSFDHARTVEPNHLHPHPFRWLGFLVRLSGIALTAWIAARWLSRPINQMARAASELGESLERAPLDETRGPSEIRQASKVFNQMQARLKKQIAERNRFLAAVSHDLRTPITRLKLRAEKIDAQDLQEDIRSDLNEMTAMIDATLDYLRGDERPEDLCLLDVSSLVHSLAENAEERGEIVTVSGIAQPIMAQPMTLQRCLNNLIENALRYGDRADIELDDTGDKLIISIRDAGAGIPEDQLEAVFAPFYRLDQSRSRNTGGVGLGLSIARDIAQKLGGSLALRNAPEGGLVATLALPKVK
jgi:signal transduction histidine kinase